MIPKIRAIIHLQLVFFILVLSVTLVPFLLISSFLPDIPNMHFYFVGALLFLRFILPVDITCKKSDVKNYLSKAQLFSGQRLVDYTSYLKSSKDIFLVSLGMIIFFIGINS